MIRRPPRSTLSSSSAASDVYKRQIGYPFAFNLQDMSSRKLYRAVMAADATTGVIEQQKALELHIIEAFAPITIRKVFGLEKLSVGGNANNKKGSCTEDRAVCPYELSRNGTKLVALHFAKQSLGIRTTPCLLYTSPSPRDS
eukprot:TRINITY_DN53015_c0_g1_i1.p1 TRINITY_DN53015_c0_g1~~TRINITY_DN53015_c0_g1_i1.p1  ORF type:complete len:142 (-),score=24.10 TRINITY_DN53015_c0_g1_i1:151-576(-)